MKPKLIIGIAIIIILVISMIGIIFVGSGGLIPPDGGEDPNNEPDSRVYFTEPINEYEIPYTGPWHHVDIELSLNEVTEGYFVELLWHGNLDWAKKSIDVFENTDTIRTNMEITRLGTGIHSLKAKLYDDNNVLVDESVINIEVPDYYVYNWDSEDNDFPNDVWIGINGGTWFYGFTFPYMQDGSKYYLRGEISRVQGEVHVGFPVFCNSYGEMEHGCSHDLWLDLWNTELDEWFVVHKDNRVSVCKDNTDTNYLNPDPCDWEMEYQRVYGWYPVDSSFDAQWGNEIGYAGCCIDVYEPNDPNDDVVDGFIGTVWIKPGTQMYDVDPLTQFFNWIDGKGNQNKPPRPIPSDCETCG